MGENIKCKIKYTFDEETQEKGMEVEGNIYSLAYGICDLIETISKNTDTNFNEILIMLLKKGGNKNE